jgi:hypothetical protein
MILIALSGDIELNPGFKFLNDIKKNRGLIKDCSLKCSQLRDRSLFILGVGTEEKRKTL